MVNGNCFNPLTIYQKAIYQKAMQRVEQPHEEVHLTPSVIEPGHTFGTVTDKISTLVLRKRTPIGWYFGFLLSFAVMNVLMFTIAYLLLTGIGIWGNNVPVGWAFDIINFVWWIGIGHAGTLISAILLLLRQEWRTSINRFAEAMTLFAVACAGLFPLLHTGRPWLAYWLFPYPNTMGIQPQFRSPLMWDVFAVSTYATVSALFWFIGLIPDFATLRDRAKSRAWQKVTDCWLWAGEEAHATGCAMRRPTFCSRGWRRPSFFPFTLSSVSTSPFLRSQGGTRPSFRLTS